MAFLYGTNNADFPGYHQKSDKKNYHALYGRFMPRVKKIDKSILDVRENYKGFRKQNLIGTSNIILENIKKTRNKN